MQPEEGDPGRLWDIADAAASIADFIAHTDPDAFATDDLLRSAVERKIEIIGEAAGKISTSLQEANPDVPWRAFVDMRNFVVHQCRDVHYDALWVFATRRVPDLVKAIAAPLSPEPPEQA
ncbi:MAG TPA: HepT-like ribonuclease domain-containing protein [Dehalococcoidia bacterium]